jgi:CheY-like chemotaxis protein
MMEAESRGELRHVTHVLLDKNMPRMDGLELARNLLARKGSKIAIGACTADSTPEARDDCFSAGMVGVLTKPFSASEVESLLQVMDACLATPQK